MINDETIEQKAIKLISKYSPWLKENLLIEEHLYEFDDVAGLIELAIAEEREACAGVAEAAGSDANKYDIADSIRARGDAQKDEVSE